MSDQETPSAMRQSSIISNNNNTRLPPKSVVPPTIEFLLKEVYKCYKERVNALEQEIKCLQAEKESKYKKNQKCSKCLNSTECVEELSAYYSQLLQEKHDYIKHLERQLSLQKNQSPLLTKANTLTDIHEADKDAFRSSNKKRKPLTSDNCDRAASKIIKTNAELNCLTKPTTKSKSPKKRVLQEIRKNKENKEKQEEQLNPLGSFSNVFDQRTTIKVNKSPSDPKQSMSILQHKHSFLNESPDLFNSELLVQPKKDVEIHLKDLKLNLEDNSKEANLHPKLIAKEMVPSQSKATDKSTEKLAIKGFVNKNHSNDTLLSSSNSSYDNSGVENKSKLICDTITSVQQIKNTCETKQIVLNNKRLQSTFDNCAEQAAVDLKKEKTSSQQLNPVYDGKSLKISPLINSMDETFVDFSALQNFETQIGKEKIKINCFTEHDQSSNKLNSLTDSRLKLKEKTDDLNDSFDKLPDKLADEPEFKFRGEPVRNKEERKKLNGFKCKICKDYYEGMDLNEEELKLRIKECSRHRDKYEAPSTPENFWSVDFPSTEECKKRGNAAETQYLPLKSRRRRPLQ